MYFLNLGVKGVIALPFPEIQVHDNPHLRPTDSMGSSKSLTSFDVFGPMARDIIATQANTIGSTDVIFCRLAINNNNN